MQAYQEPEFVLGLTMAGAISAGAYSAGVFDFLIQALEEWEKAKEADNTLPEEERGVPNHRVIIPVISGASAGGITAALGLLAVGAGVRLPEPNDGTDQRCALPELYEAWVKQISFTPRNGRSPFLLGTSDLKRERLSSLLDATIIKAAADKLLKATGKFTKAQPYFASNLHLFLTVTNLRGIPYTIAFAGSDGHVMTVHADRIHYRFKGFGTASFESAWLESYGDEGVVITPQMLGEEKFREEYREAAIATGAFPIGLPACLIERHTSDYKSRAWTFPQRQELDNIEPVWPARAEDGSREYAVGYAASDGGLIDNEPFELSHWTIMKTPGTPNATRAEKADRAVLMIDPFPTPSSFDPDLSAEEVKEQLWLRAVIFSLFPTLKDQARVKAIDLARAAREDVFSRFLVSPSRQITKDGPDVHPAIASAVFGAFGGFLCREFPDHDYQLGRRNCQWFLRQHLMLDVGNALFKTWPKRAAQNPQFNVERDGKKFRTVIPLLGSAGSEVEPLPWPRISEDVIERFIEHVKLRSNELVPKVIWDEMKDFSRAKRGALHFAWRWCRNDIFEWVRFRLVADLIRGDQHEKWSLLQDDRDRLIIAALFDPTVGVRTAGGIARGIRRGSRGRVSPTADEVRKRLHGELAEYVVSSGVGDKERFLIRKEPRGWRAWFKSSRK